MRLIASQIWLLCRCWASQPAQCQLQLSNIHAGCELSVPVSDLKQAGASRWAGEGWDCALLVLEVGLQHTILGLLDSLS